MNKQLTVGELRELLSHYPEDYPMWVSTGTTQEGVHYLHEHRDSVEIIHAGVVNQDFIYDDDEVSPFYKPALND